MKEPEAGTAAGVLIRIPDCRCIPTGDFYFSLLLAIPIAPFAQQIRRILKTPKFNMEYSVISSLTVKHDQGVFNMVKF